MHRRLPGLDAIRGVAELVVVFMHNSTGLQGGHLAVDLFFMLSGFVMARSYEDQLKSGQLRPAAFMKLRVKRLWPTMAVGAVIGFAAALASSGLSPAILWALVCALLLVPASTTAPYVLNLPAWSIFYELLANAAHAGTLARVSVRGLLAVVLVAAGVVVVSLATIGFPRILPITTTMMQALVIARLAVSYGIGVVLYRVVGDSSPVRLPFAFGVIALPAYVALVAVYPFPGWQLPFIFVVAPMMLLSGLDQQAPAGIWTILGAISLPLYAVHMPVMQVLATLGIGGGLFAIGASVAVASLWLIPWRAWLGTMRREPVAAAR
jgi:peptidoglycan/LPS O-acetylase OafA/YrhL